MVYSLLFLRSFSNRFIIRDSAKILQCNIIKEALGNRYQLGEYVAAFLRAVRHVGQNPEAGA